MFYKKQNAFYQYPMKNKYTQTIDFAPFSHPGKKRPQTCTGYDHDTQVSPHQHASIKQIQPRFIITNWWIFSQKKIKTMVSTHDENQ